MQDYILKLQREYIGQLTEASVDYLRTGLDLFHIYRKKARLFTSSPMTGVDSERNSPQTALGNLGISLELMFKAIIAGEHLLLLFKDIPEDVFSLRDTLISSDSKVMTIDFYQCEKLCYILFPDLRQSLEPHLNHLRKARNVSVHSFLPNLSYFEVERAAYVAIHVHEILNATLGATGAFSFLSFTGYVYTDEDRAFERDFQDARLNSVKEKIKKAREKAQRLKEPRVAIDPANDWEHYVIRCYICDNDVVLEGYTDTKEVCYDDDWYEKELTFFPANYKCPKCGLALDDPDEMQIANIPTQFDRSSEIEG